MQSIELNVPPTVSPPADEQHWYALKIFGNKLLSVEHTLSTDGYTTFFPVENKVVQRPDGSTYTRRRPIVSSLLFFRGSEADARRIQQRHRQTAMLYTTRRDWSEVPYIIPEREMNLFMLVASKGSQGMEFLDADSAVFRKGQRVQVIDGKFKGAEGYICRIRKNSRLVVSITGICAMVTSYIPQAFLRKIP